MNTMFEHSVKVPRHYKVAANIFKKAYTEGGSVKTLLYDEKLRHFRTNVLYALITETIKHAVEIDKIFESCEILTKEPRLDPWLAKVLAVELLFGKKTLPGKSKPEQTILSYKEQLEKIVPEHQDDLKSKVVRRPRYVRINTNLLATSDAIRAFQDEGYKFIRCTSGTYDDYLQQIQRLTEYDFTQDYHVKTMFVFAPGTKLHEHDLYLENQIILQDKATALAVHLLAPPPGSVALDMCAAPGMKTTQLAAYLRNQGKIYAVERNEDRYKTLCDFVERTGSKCVETLHKDSLEIKRGDYDDVEYILLDPSCSGSGMDLHVHNYIEDTRLARLTSLQEKFLKHAMNSFPNAKRIVYSTCSLFPEENERVITNIVKASRAKWRVQDVKELLKGQWNNFGSGMYGSIGTRCLYSIPNSDYTTGFFLAVLDRDPKEFEKSQEKDSNVEKGENKRNKSKNNDEDTDTKGEEDILNDGEADVKENRKKKKKVQAATEKSEPTNIEEELKNAQHKKESSFQDIEGAILENDTPIDVEEIKQKRKKKKKNKKIVDSTNKVDNDSNNTENTSETKIENSSEVSNKKKKRKRKEESVTDLTVDEDDRENNKHIEESIRVDDSEITNDCSDYVKTKKKKKRKTKEESLIDLTINEDNSKIVESKDEVIYINDFENIDNSNIYEVSKKTKKKHKADESIKDFTVTEGSYVENIKKTSNVNKNEGFNDITDNENIISTNNYEISKKENIKDKACVTDNNIISADIYKTVEDTKKKSKKKNKVKESSENNLNAEENIDSSNKKKKHKSKHVENSEVLDVNELNDAVPKKKKKL